MKFKVLGTLFMDLQVIDQLIMLFHKILGKIKDNCI